MEWEGRLIRFHERALPSTFMTYIEVLGDRKELLSNVVYDVTRRPSWWPSLPINEFNSLNNLGKTFIPTQSSPYFFRIAHKLKRHGQGRCPRLTAAGLGGVLANRGKDRLNPIRGLNRYC